ncbi:hypothetical protein LOM8899_00201 [Flavimaricola marinus]|uniref:Lipoprotein n=2 Tax=Flavimaricola marinus TaxID=1819565 RepID=A0A238LAZ4_9RHOB|nr:hypothetical protein LOM8899_00201 [Flavimaricola marinus]
MTYLNIGKGAVLAASLFGLSACVSYSTDTMGNDSLIGDDFVGASGCSNLSAVGNIVNQTNRDDVRCGPQSVSPIL